MATEDLHELVSELTSNIDDLEATLAPLTQKPLASTSSTLPLLDKAKLHVLATYALESVLFNSLRLHGTDAKSHPVFAELNRVKEYFGKIKKAEGTEAKPSTRVDKEAAGRFIKAGLAGNERGDQQSNVREKAGAKRKAEGLGGGAGTHTRFSGAAKRIKFDDEGAAVHVGPAEPMLSVHSDSDPEGGVAVSSSGAEQMSKRKNKPSEDAKKEEKRLRRQQAKEAKLSPHGTAAPDVEMEEEEQPAARSNKPPKSSKEALESLLDGASTKLEKPGRRKKKKAKGQALEDERADEMK